MITVQMCSAYKANIHYTKIKPFLLRAYSIHGYITLAGLNFTEAKMIIFLHLLQYNFTQGHLFALLYSWGHHWLQKAHYDNSSNV